MEPFGSADFFESQDESVYVKLRRGLPTHYYE